MDSAGDLIKGGSGGATVKLDLGAADYVVKANTAGTDTEFGQIVNASVASSAAIAGTKISPDFGSQNVITTGSVTGSSLKVSADSFLDGNSTTTQVRVQADNTPVALFQRFAGSSGRLSLAGADGNFGGLEITVDSSVNTTTIRPDRTDTRLDLGVRFNPSAITIRGVNNASSNGDYNGYVGMGTTAPEANLEVVNPRTTGGPIDNAIVKIKSTNRNAALDIETSIVNSNSSVINFRNAGTTNSFYSYNHSNYLLTYATFDGRTGSNNFNHFVDRSGRLGLGVVPTGGYALEMFYSAAYKPAGQWTNASDARLKENIEDADLGICYDIVKDLPLKRYRWKDSAFADDQVIDRTIVGWIAQDVQAVFPKAIQEKEMTLADGTVLEDSLSMDETMIMHTLYGAVQRLMEKVEALELEVSTLRDLTIQ
jgi:hypothetical protein